MRHDGRVAMEDLPGGDLVRAGLADLAAGYESVASLLVEISATNLRLLGFPVPSAPFFNECGVPTTVQAISANPTAASPTGPGQFVLYNPAGADEVHLLVDVNGYFE
jgi:hypothetical protein